MATVTFGPAMAGLVEKYDIAWLGATTALTPENFAWLTPEKVAAIYTKSANRQAYISYRPGSTYSAIQQLVQAAPGALPNVYEFNLKAPITLDDSLFSVLPALVPTAPVLSSADPSTGNLRLAVPTGTTIGEVKITVTP